MLKPLGDRVIVKVQEQEEETVGGIVLANNAKEKPQTGEIVAVSEGTLAEDGKRVPLSVKNGQVVMFDKYAGSEVKYEGEDYLVLHEKDIMAVVE
ncbi:co-chaperone GroES [Agrilactobacillus fermenti]|uniref:co-chaperone GroES n=1 Tax=Agrilactobacillus fermenti TaxID=2586909 RepID=UPI001E3A233F|nr:co-chaperone GroES [Agrilactobacillus fermenti]MCD2256751.1 co-chaperone GroES [Agrilactobacillus fermenti]